MRDLLNSALLALGAGSTTQLQSRDTVTIAPVAIPADQNWDGIDGSWSTFTLRVGTPTQYVRVLLSFNGYQTWVVIPEGCSGAQSPSDCADSRGGVFNYTGSSTWQKVGTYDLYIEENLGLTGNARYGYETVGLAGAGENGPTLKNTTVGGFATNDFYLGLFGVNPKPTNFSSYNDPSPSYMTQLKDQRLIPSLSVAYTAGAKYRFSGVYASLTLGGYDSDKYTANNITWNFGADNDHQLIVGLQTITVPNKDVSNNVAVKLLPSPVYIEIDPTVAQIWLPTEACQAFEAEFGLVWDNTTNLYLINSTQHDSLRSRNANVTFTLGQTLVDGPTVNIVLPYAAFDQSISPPFPKVSSNSYYFPLRRGANNTQFILGRTFMQEAYIIVDYEVSRFQLGQTIWNQYAGTSLQAIGAANASTDSSLWTSSSYKPSYTSSTGSGGSGPNGLGAGAIAGIVVGAVLGIAVIVLVVLLLIRRRRRRSQATEIASNSDGFADEKKGDRGSTQVFPKAELAGSEPSPFGLTHHDMDRKGLHSPMYPPSSSGTTAYSPHSAAFGEGVMSHSPLAEAHSRAIYEMPGDMPNREKDGRQLSEKEALQHRERIYNGIDEAVDQSPRSATAQPRERRAVAPGEVVDARTGDGLGRHRAFSFDFDSSEGQSRTHDSDRTLANSEPSPADGSTSIGLADGGVPSPATPRHGNFL